MKGLLVIALIVTALSTNAQFKFGVAGGLNVSEFSDENINSSLSYYSSVVGFNTGMIFEVKFPDNIGVEMDLLYSTKGTLLDLKSRRNLTSEFSLKYIDIPIVAKVYLFKVTSLQLGVQYSYLLGANHNNQLYETDVKDNFNSSDFSIAVGFGIDVNRLHFSTRYNPGIIGISKGGSTKINMLTFSVGLWLKK